MLVTLASFPRKLYTKVDSQRNPYLPADEQYFDGRLARSMKSSLAGRRKLAWLWRWQDGVSFEPAQLQADIDAALGAPADCPDPTGTDPGGCVVDPQFRHIKAKN